MDIINNAELYRQNQIKRFEDPAIVDLLIDVHAKIVRNNFIVSKMRQLKREASRMISTKNKIPKVSTNVGTDNGNEVGNDIGTNVDTNVNANIDATNHADDILDVNVVFEKVKSVIEDINTRNVSSEQFSFDSLDKSGIIQLSRLIGTYTDNFNIKIPDDDPLLVRSGVYLTGINVGHLSNGFSYDSLFNTLFKMIGNLVHDDVPIYKDEENNVLIPDISHKIDASVDLSVDPLVDPTFGGYVKVSHVELCNKLDILDRDAGIRIAGNRGYFLKGHGVRLNMALMMYAIEFLSDRDYTPISTPQFMTSESLQNICQFGDYKDTLYNVDHDKYLIATSEQPLTALHHNRTFDKDQLPIKYAGTSTCFRKEAGRDGHDTLGIFRVHQFEKIEQFCITNPTDNASDNMFINMLQNATDFYDSLGLSYRVINIVSGALNLGASKKYDIEGYFEGSGTYRELVSCSNCTDYFSKRLGIKNHKGEYVHMLNSTLCANTRTLCCILEKYQTAEGILVPPVLRKYMGNLKIIPYTQ